MLYVTARCHHSYRKNDSPNSVECDIVMIDTSSSQQRGMRGISSPCQNVGGCIPHPPAVDARDVYLLRLCVTGTRELWPYLILLQAMPALLSLVVLPFLPDTPRYLLLVRRNREGAISGRIM